ncbi:MAG TPA: amidohydrolase family protein [Opitutaceae bacterium]|jgi:L-fuconolactonase|nr:amidohydrolase family protein [Opitutaceae bacterium]
MGPEFTDSHVHFWDASLRRYPWLAEVPAIAGAHGPNELALESQGETPSRIVFVQADCERSSAMDEVAWVESISGSVPKTSAVVAFAPMDSGQATVEILQTLASKPLVRGVRHLIQGEADPGFCLSKEFVSGVQECGRLGLSFDLCVRHPQLASVTELVRRCPDTSFILDHAGKPDLRSAIIESWRANIADLAKLPNVTCKLSGLVTEAGTAALEIDRFEPVMAHLLATFGPSRLLFGSDWPVVKLAMPYPTWLGMAKKLLAQLSESEQSAIFSGNAARVYRLG